MDENKGEIVQLNKEQLRQGLDSKGGRLGRYKSKAYEAKKMALNPLAGGYIDLRLKGNLLSELFAEIRGEIVFIGSTDFKESFVFRRFPSALGLNIDSRTELIRNTLRPAFISKIKHFLTAKL